MSEANRLRPDWNLGDEETPELDAYRNNFIDFANFFADDMFGTEMVHRRIKTRKIFDLASSAYLDLRRAAHRAEQDRKERGYPYPDARHWRMHDGPYRRSSDESWAYTGAPLSDAGVDAWCVPPLLSDATQTTMMVTRTRTLHV